MRGQLRQTAPATPWLPVQRRSGPSAGTAPVVICFPPAGAGAGFFREWGLSLPDVRLVPVQLPGREERFAESAQDDVAVLADAVADAIVEEAWQRPVLLGYSYGSLLAFETSHRLEERGVEVGGMIAMARAAPQSTPLPTVADLPDEAFLDYVRGLGGLPPEIDELPDLRDLMLPIMRADFRANDGYAARETQRLLCQIVTLSGTVDAATADGRDAAWATRTETSHRLVRIDGGHFFVNEKPGPTFDILSDVIQSLHVANGGPR